MNDPMLGLAQKAVALAMTIVDIEDALDAAEANYFNVAKSTSTKDLIDTIRNIIKES